MSADERVAGLVGAPPTIEAPTPTSAEARAMATVTARANAFPGSTIAGFVLWAAAVAVGYRAQYAFTPLNRVTEGTLLYSAAAALAIAGVALIDRRAPLVEVQWKAVALGPWRWRSPRVVAAVLLTLLGLAADGAAVYVLAIQPRGRQLPPTMLYDPTTPYGKAFWLWIVSLVVLLIAFALAARNRYRFRLGRPTRTQWLDLATILVLVVVALALRLPDVGRIPYETHGDEAAIGLEARRILRGDIQSLFWAGWAGVPDMSYAIPAAFMTVFGDNLFGLRLASVVQGTLSVILTYLIVRRLFGWRVAALAGLFLALSHWHIHFSRTGFHYMQALFAGTLLSYLLFRAIETRRAADYLLAGFAAGLGFEVYYGSRLAPVLGGLYVLHRAAIDRTFLRQQWTGMLTVILGALLFFAPTAVYFSTSLDTFMNRTQSVMLTNPEVQKHLKNSYRVPTLGDVLLVQSENSLLAFNYRGETSLQYGHKGPLIDFWTGVFFVMGLAVVTLRLLRPRYSFVAAWFWLTLFTGSVMTVDALFSPRVLLMAPALFIVAAIAIDAGWRAIGALVGRVGVYAFAVPVAALAVLAARENYYQYFELHIKNLQPAGFATTFSNYVNSINDRYRVYWVAPADNYIRYDTIDFLVPKMDAVDVRDKPLALPLDRVPRNKGVAFLVRVGQEARLEQIERQYPGGEEQLVKQTNGFPHFHAYLVSNQSLLAANPSARIDDERIPVLTPAELDAQSKQRPAG